MALSKASMSGEPRHESIALTQHHSVTVSSEQISNEPPICSSLDLDPKQHPRRSEEVVENVPINLSSAVTLRLYLSHFLSTWNARLFEFAAVLFLAAIFPGTLLPISIYALVRGASAVLFAQAIGSWIDHGNRLVVMRVSIVGQRLAVGASCGLFWVMQKHHWTLKETLGQTFFAMVVVLACVEKVCFVMNTVAVERDWVVVMTSDNGDARKTLNARMRRIDLFCKLGGPLLISVVAIASSMVAIWTTLAMNILSVLAEYICIEQVYRRVPSLAQRGDSTAGGNSLQRQQSLTTLQSLKSFVVTAMRHTLPIRSLPFYFRHSAFLPSFSLSLLYLTVLSFSGQMITLLLAVGYTSLYVGIARTVSTILELSATWIAPRLMNRIGPVRSGIWHLSWQMIWLTAGVGYFFGDFYSSHELRVSGATGLAVGVALSRIGLWGFDLSAQLIIQDEVEEDYRGSFSTVEAAFQNLAEMASYATTIVFSHPRQFLWPTLISIMAVYLSGGLYTYYVRRSRGHLLHKPAWIRLGGNKS